MPACPSHNLTRLLDYEQAVKAECPEIVSGGEHSHKYDRSAVERVAQIRSERYLR